MWFASKKILKHKPIQVRNPTYVFVSLAAAIKLLSRISPELAEANADYANHGAHALARQ